MPKVRNFLTPITFCSSASHTQNCLLVGSYRFFSLMYAQILLTTSCRGITSDPTIAANSGDSEQSLPKPVFFLAPPAFFFFFPQSSSESESEPPFFPLPFPFLADPFADFFFLGAAFFLLAGL
uniref:Uncharacterized protein n=1 Tax=Cacopsylla melanoneura TaxID=428564 RepID=A0A8D8U1G1_9HEMI